jgi:HK97 gp10 family phage protein
VSGVVGLEAVKAKLSTYDLYLAKRLDEAIEQEARAFQADLVASAPVKDGDLRAALASPDAIRIKRKGGNSVIEVGFLTTAQKKQGFHAFFVEFGTKGYAKGQKRFSGKTKRGYARFSKIKRDIPARPAHPFWRPAFARLVERLKVARARAHALALADMARGG